MHEVAIASSQAVEQIGNALDDLTAAAREPAKLANGHVEAMLKRVEAKIDELNPRRRDDDKTIDLPPLPLRPLN